MPVIFNSKWLRSLNLFMAQWNVIFNHNIHALVHDGGKG